MYYIYILYSSEIDKYYVGQIYDLQKRLDKHSLKTTRFTKRASDWKLMYQEVFETRVKAIQREREIKSKKSRKYIGDLIASAD